MLIELVVIIESFTAEATERVSLEASLVDSSRFIVASSHMLLQILICE
jgi:hypothetical protein